MSALLLARPPSKNDKRVPSSTALPSVAPVSEEVVAFKGLPLTRVKKKRKQRENPRPTVVASHLVAIPSQECRVK